MCRDPRCNRIALGKVLTRMREIVDLSFSLSHDEFRSLQLSGFAWHSYSGHAPPFQSFIVSFAAFSTKCRTFRRFQVYVMWMVPSAAWITAG